MRVALRFLGALMVSVVFVVITSQIPLTQIQTIPSEISATKNELVQIKDNDLFGKYINLEAEETVETFSKGNIKNQINFKLFNLFNINTVDVNVVKEDKVYLGGNAVGFLMDSEGVMVVGANSVLTKKGKINTIENSDVKVGDVIISIDNKKIENIYDIEKYLNKGLEEEKQVEVVLKRKGKEIKTKIKPALDVLTKKYKLGLWIKDDTAGVGTLTYVRKDNKRFGALGHPICDIDTKVPYNISEGNMYTSNIIGVKKGRKGDAGELKGLFSKGKKVQAKVDKNTDFGVFGKVNEDCDYLLEDNLIEIGGRLTARPGKAKIRANIEGSSIKEYDIEIIKTNYQSVSKQKSMVIRVTDKELIEKTGGIVQGMSGSPILQNGKIVGAVTHVFLNDPKKGFGVYLDWMIDQ